MAFTLPALDYAPGALAARGMSQETLDYHHGKHHRAYVDALNALVAKDPALQGKTAEDLVLLARDKPDLAAVFNNAGQHLNHSLFWKSLSPAGGAVPPGLERKLTEDFGSVAAFKEAFKTAATTQFGSGWAWLALGQDGRLKVTKTPDAAGPLATGEGKPLLVLDVWEHAYYIDYRNRRPDFVANFLDRLANYAFAEAMLPAG